MAQGYKRSPNASDFIRNHSGNFLNYDSERCKHAEIASRLVFDAILLGVSEIKVHALDGWHLILSTEAWFLRALGSFSVDSLFERIIPFPQAGANACRSEILVGAFADQIIVAKEGNILYEKKADNKPIPPALIEIIESHVAIIGFALSKQ
jgi:hypothetical protein